MVLESGMLSISSWGGSISANEFRIAALAFADKWEKCNSSFSHWSWVSPKRLGVAADNVEGYLCLQNVLILKGTKDNCCDEASTDKSKEETCFHNEDDPIDNATLVQSSDGEAHYFDFHIVYSNSYRVPVLYFRGYCIDGQPLMLDDIEKDLPANSSKLLSESKWTFITQEEHPYLNRPWYTLHPCGTCEWMKLLYANETPMINRVLVDQYLVSWFSVAGQVIGLKIPLEMLRS
ncbi:ubiquitin-like-conjugating enzyme ATG10 [Apium graveolens]|uniref:ubiquitin-like-conjugating enzyme ATG10 n=1 Tax=Apium graveolens TaxID=4045 RepID=UPI003D7B2E7D